MDLTDIEKEKIRTTIDTMLTDGYEFAKSNRNFIRWMATSSLAVLAFFLTVLLQMKAKMELPLKPVAITAFALLLFCILTGFYARYRFEAKDWFSKVTGMWTSFITIIRIALDHGEKTQLVPTEEAKLLTQGLDDFINKMNLAQTEVFKINPARIMLMQGLSLALGICAISFYIFYYLFIFAGIPKPPF
jgi:hypothetical protein